MDLQILLMYIATATIFSFAPGSGTVNSISNGIKYGMRKSLPAILGLQIGLSFHIVLVGAGIGTLVAQSAIAFTVIKWVGVAYLIWLGIQKWRETASLQISEEQKMVSGWQLMRNAVFINLTNPKSIVFLVALLPPFIDPAQDQFTQLAILGVTTIIIDVLVMLFYTGMAAQFGKLIRSEKVMSKMNRIFGSMFIGCGALLATARA
ncbi:Homoserine/homoserine lactone efflux protein [Vibrio nigripulchritudo SFn27]|uniref:Homoserine/homoserine lactone efflux protein n=1 Tax=Vibrio nigripulchritudo TaxID=28173 RepID=U4KAD6_9VIBR|nr:homoserine/homoserine lactone efflux protein [Vibrio nigripulchritudo]CCN80428.1 Homoserine/homoserine lactone efflux protein [Vibrio nigripulchritudo BLFn1]CCN88415.1 Homoserine/homoserine lactone efflux protein [Vibrio nigripulchritudo SFn27]CCN92563.1 Homoserine/homoserine lactone efflux protein [Vibrio nigripulchritudo ENn2]CCO40950.1 Homoserine/homoserine lactone efflux protein [Vibrio nigripulchritudo SFn135]CCO50512.1 Homoserine/homoserine lactone efflux protein [Vibrio nigripulchrit